MRSIETTLIDMSGEMGLGRVGSDKPYQRKEYESEKEKFWRDGFNAPTDAAAVSGAADQLQANTLHTEVEQPAAAPELKPGDLVIGFGNVSGKEYTTIFARIDEDGWLRGFDVKDKRPVSYEKYRLPTPTELAQFAGEENPWIEHKGGSCPVKDWDAVEVKLDGDQERSPPMVIRDHATECCQAHWRHECTPNSGMNIVAYRRPKVPQ